MFQSAEYIAVKFTMKEKHHVFVSLISNAHYLLNFHSMKMITVSSCVREEEHFILFCRTNALGTLYCDVGALCGFGHIHNALMRVS